MDLARQCATEVWRTEVVAVSYGSCMHQPPNRSTRSRRRRLLFALAPVGALLLFGELIARAVRGPLYFGSFRAIRTDLMRRNYPAELHPTLGYVPKAGFASRDNHWGTVVSIDGDGMRNNGTSPAPAGAKVIAAVGDSFTFGDEVDDDATWPAALEKILGKPVKNGGVFGYSLAQSVLRAEAMLDRFAVETVVLSLIPDDIGRSEFRKRYTLLPVFRFAGEGLELSNVPLQHDAPADASSRWKDALGHSALLDAIFANTVRAWWFENEKQQIAPELAGRGPELADKLVARLWRRCQAQGVGLLIVLQGERDRAEPVAVARGLLRKAKALGAKELDLLGLYEQARAEDPSVTRRWFRGHMTREGNAWAAARIAAALRTGD